MIPLCVLLIGSLATAQIAPGWADTQGGEGGRTIHVTTLDKEGPGSLRAALEAEGPRVIVFDVAGAIDLDSGSIRVEEPFVTLAGETAPSPGITVIRGEITIRTHDVIVRHLRIRPGEAGHAKASGWEVDGLNTGGGAYDVLIEHCSVSWSPDENLTVTGPRFRGDDVEQWRANTSHRVTLYRCLIAEGLYASTHRKVLHSRGTLVHDNVTDVAIIGNLYASNNQRNPMFKGGARGVVANNVIHNPGMLAMHYLLAAREWEGHEHVEGWMTVVNNVLQPGPSTPAEPALVDVHGLCQVYVSGNVLRRSGDEQPFNSVNGMAQLADAPLSWPGDWQPMPTNEVFEAVLADVGARPWDRDAVDARIIAEVRSGEGSLKNSETEAEGYPR